MPYIGKAPISGGFHKLDSLTASATDTYALTLGSAAYYPETANQLLVSLNGVIQAPQDSFTVSGSNLVFDSALTASDSIDFVVALGDVLGVGTPTDGSITTAKIGNGAVTDAKIDTMAASKLTGSLSSASMPTGSIVQIVSQNFTTGASTTTLNTFVATGKSVSITPTSSSNKILLLGSIPLHASGISSGAHAIFSIFRGGVASGTNLGHSSFGMGQVYSNSGDNIVTLSLNHIDTPATTSSVTYEIGITQRNPGITQTNLCVNNETYNITLMEIVG